MGGGIFHLVSPAVSGSINSNTAQSTNAADGPQVYVDTGGTFTVNGSTGTTY
jgi:hypothetical protein